MNPIDGVISWVDGYDPVYQQKLKDFCLERGIDKNAALEPTRIQQCNEIHYCLHALRRFAPWLRTIYIITNKQIPATVRDLQGSAFGNKIRIIDQNELLREHNIKVPIFNSLSIEWLIWKIKDLSPQFLYLNDDFFVIREIAAADFFRNNCLVLRGQWKVQTEKKWAYQIKNHLPHWLANSLVKKDPHRAWQEKSARLAGWDRHFYLLPHAPLPLMRETFENYIAQHPELFTENIAYPFRHPEQVSSIPLMVHLDIHAQRIIYARNKHKAIMVNGDSHSLRKIKSRLKTAQANPQVAFVCMQSIDQAVPRTRHYMLNWLQRHIDC